MPKGCTKNNQLKIYLSKFRNLENIKKYDEMKKGRKKLKLSMIDVKKLSEHCRSN
jgi:hypothetical protein